MCMCVCTGDIWEGDEFRRGIRLDNDLDIMSLPPYMAKHLFHQSFPYSFLLFSKLTFVIFREEDLRKKKILIIILRSQNPHKNLFPRRNQWPKFFKKKISNEREKKGDDG